MNFGRFIVVTGLSALAMVASADANDRCHPCRPTSVGSTEHCLRDIRGTACVTSINPERVVFEPTRGIHNFSIENVLFQTIDNTDVLSTIFNADVRAALSYHISFDVAFNCPFDSDPTVVIGLEIPSNSEVEGAILNSFGSYASNVSREGFTANLAFSIYGESNVSAFELLVNILNSDGDSCVNFIAQSK